MVNPIACKTKQPQIEAHLIVGVAITLALSAGGLFRAIFWIILDRIWILNWVKAVVPAWSTNAQTARNWCCVKIIPLEACETTFALKIEYQSQSEETL